MKRKPFKVNMLNHPYKKYDIVVWGYYHDSVNIVVKINGYEITLIPCPPKMNGLRRKLWFFFLRLRLGWNYER